MTNINLNELLKKSENEKAIEVFVEIVNFVKDVKPILETMNATIYEGVNKMPTASKKLAKVTEATEIATTEILNIIDNIYPKIDLIRKGNSVPENLDSIEMDMSNIMMSLQVQDITSQQIAAVNHTLITIQSKLNNLLNHFDSSYIKEILNIELPGYKTTTDVTNLHRTIAFDPEAIDAFGDVNNRQDVIDQLINMSNNGQDLSNFEIPQNKSQDKNLELPNTGINNEEDISDLDIDALFAGNNQVSNNDIDALFNNDQKASNDDIDALFSNNSNNEELSAEDIDALFK